MGWEWGGDTVCVAGWRGWVGDGAGAAVARVVLLAAGWRLKGVLWKLCLPVRPIRSCRLGNGKQCMALVQTCVLRGSLGGV